MSELALERARERLLPGLLVLPALVFALPFSPLRDDPFPHLAGAGWAVLLLSPLGLFLLAGGAHARGAWPFLVALGWGTLVSLPLAGVTDGLEARRVLLQLAALLLAFAGGATLSAGGRALYAVLLVLLSCAWTSLALLTRESLALAGVLRDTGSLSQAALPGAAIGALWLARERGGRRALGALATVLFLLHAALAPVLAGAHSLLAALALSALLGGRRGRRALAGLALLALAVPFLGEAWRELRSTAVTASPARLVEASGRSLGGLGVRQLVWRRALALASDHPWLGSGPGQFQAAFPPYRDPREIELSRHGVCSEESTEVEHAHDDWLEASCELGLPAGLLFALGLLLAARAALRSLAAEEGALAAALLAALVNALVHSPLLYNPASGPLVLALCGALLQAGGAARAPSRGAAWACALPALVALVFAPALVAHGRALADYIRSARAISELASPSSTASERVLGEFRSAREALARALAAAPGSAPARTLSARLATEGEQLEAWERVLAVRPHSVEAWERSATVCARGGDVERARAGYARALELSPTHPRILKNLARLEFRDGDPDLGRGALERLRATGCLDPRWREELGAELVLLAGRSAAGAELLAEQALAELSPELLHARSREEGLDGLVADALEALAQLLWARDHARSGAFELSVRSYRQALNRSRSHGEPGAAPLRLEMAAALVRAGKAEEARELAAGLVLDGRTAPELPDWARAALLESSVLDG